MFGAKLLMILSVTLFLYAVGVLFWPFFKYDSKWRPRKSALAIISFFAAVVLLIGSGVCAASIVPPTAEGTAIGRTGAERFVQVLSYTFLLFTINTTFNEAMLWVECFGGGFFSHLYTVLAVLYCGLVPLAGGFIVFNLLSAIAPKFKLLVSNFKRTKYVFSELNERSITFAESVAEQAWMLRHGKLNSDKETLKWNKNPAIIFLNVKRDDVDSEYFDRAWRIGAICMNDDILERPFSFYLRKNKKLVYFMMDTDSWANLSAAVSLLSTKRELWKKTVTPHTPGEELASQKTWGGKDIKRKPRVRLRRTDNMSMYVFTENPEANNLLNDAFTYNCERVGVREADGSMSHYIAKCDSNITIFVVNEYKNLVYELLNKDIENYGYALFAHLAGAPKLTTPENGNVVSENKKDGAPNGCEQPKKIKLALIGGGKISKEFFEAAIWCSQMLDPDHPEAIAASGQLGNAASSEEALQNSAENEDMRQENKTAGKGSALRAYATIPVSIHVLSENAKEFETSVKFSCPALFDKEGKSEFLSDVTFDDVRFGTARMSDVFDSLDLKSANMFLIALGDDDLNLQAANWVERKLLQEQNVEKTAVCYAIENDALCETLRRRYKLQTGSIRLVPFGSLKQRFSMTSVMRPDLERQTRAIDDIYNGEHKGNAFISNYNFESSLAAVIHKPYKLYGVKAGGADEAKMTDEQMSRLGWLEHRRWDAYMISAGFVPPRASLYLETKPKGKYVTKDEPVKWHACIMQTDIENGATQTQISSLCEKCHIKMVPGNGKKSVILEITSGKFKGLTLDRALTFNELLTEQNKTLEQFLAAWYDKLLAFAHELLREPKTAEVEDIVGCNDSLEQLGLFMTIYNKKLSDLKSYDLDIVHDTYLNSIKEGIMNACRRPIPDAQALEGHVAQLIKELNISDALLERKRVTYIASCLDFDILLVTGFDLDDSADKRRPKKRARVTHLSNGMKIVRQPRGKTVYIGKQGRKGYYLYSQQNEYIFSDEICSYRRKAEIFDTKWLYGVKCLNGLHSSNEVELAEPLSRKLAKKGEQNNA